MVYWVAAQGQIA